VTDWRDGCNFSLDNDACAIQELARNFATTKVAPLASKIDKEHYYPAELIGELGKLGFMGALIPEEFSGSSLSTVAYALIIEELAAACASTAIIVSAHTSLCTFPIVKFGTLSQKKLFLPKLASGENIGCFALSEPDSGSDAAGMITNYRKVDGGFIVNGTKNWITNGSVADVIILFAVDCDFDQSDKHNRITAFIHKSDLPGVLKGKPEDKLGICGSPTCSITYNQVFIPGSQVLGDLGNGFKVAMATLDGGRIGVAAQAVGIARNALETSISYANTRKSFGKKIIKHQSIGNYLAEMITKIDAARYLTLGAAVAKDNNIDFTRHAAMAKLFASETAVESARKAVQILGGYGYVKEFSAERNYRDSKITEIYEGTSEIQKLVIATRLLT
jgi:butyryl-CoA dehydrogenase